MGAKIEVIGKGNITTRVIADSIATTSGTRMLTLEIEYMRFFHSEFMTHRMLSKNAASSRAIPVKSVHENIRHNTARPIHYGRNKSGMSADVEVDHLTKESLIQLWDASRDSALAFATVMSQMGAHKQIANRLTEPYQFMKTVVSGTEWANIKWLRHHEDAQPEFFELMDTIICAVDQSSPQELYPGEWHVPYVSTHRNPNGALEYIDATGNHLTPHQAIQVSASCCAQTSYRKNDDSLEKAEEVFNKLIRSQPVHASPVEHQATPMKDSYVLGGAQYYPETWEQGVTHMDRNRKLWSGNLRGWIQHRKLIEGESVWD